MLDRQRYLARIQSQIDKHGWVVQAVVPTEDDPGPYFAYTIGLLDRGCAAEIMVSGLSVTLMHPMLNEIAASMANGTGLPPSNWPLPGEYTMIPVFITRPSPPLTPDWAYIHYDRDSVPVVQYVWPAENHSYPWEAEWPYEPDTQLVGGTGRPLSS